MPARLSSPPRDRHLRPVPSGRCLAVLSPGQAGRRLAQTGRSGDRATDTGRWGRAGSAANAWFSGVRARKSLIVERTTATGRPGFAMSCSGFATSLFFAFCRAVPSSSLSNSLKEKKKEGCEVRGISHARAPRVTAVLPRVRHAAYFLGHQSATPESADSWQLMAGVPLPINDLQLPARQSTCPRVAPRVPPSRVRLESRR